MSHPNWVAKRLARELAEVKSELPTYVVSVGLVNNNLYSWNASVKGPKDTPYEGGTFHLSFLFSDSYPMKPPTVKFLTKVFHCNINALGAICLNILKEDGWSPAFTVKTLLIAIIQLLGECNPDDGLSYKIADLHRRSKEAHDKIAREFTQKYAQEEGGSLSVSV